MNDNWKKKTERRMAGSAQAEADFNHVTGRAAPAQ